MVWSYCNHEIGIYKSCLSLVFFPHRFMATPHLSQGGTVRGEARCLDVLRPHKTSAGSGKIDQFPIGFPNKGVLIIHHIRSYD